MTKLCPRGKAAAKRKFKVYPSAYANAYASKICAGKIKDPSGVKRKDFKGPKPMSVGGKVMKAKRGKLVPGYFADMILFDPNKISTSAAYRKNDLPAKSERLIVDSIGIKETWVNGVNKNKNTAGKLIREFLS